jgi:putative phosphoesterase
MRIAIISDLHANLEALQAMPDDYDQLWVLGDLVNYGPNPSEVVDFVRSRASVILRGNHDHAVGNGEKPRCSARFTAMAEATQEFTNRSLSEEQRQFLRELPLYMCSQAEGTIFFLCHATPSDPLFEYRSADSPLWEFEEEIFSGADVVLVGHTHQQLARNFDRWKLVNPGSLGQPKMGDPKARYALWEDGNIKLRSFTYPVHVTIAKLHALGLPATVADDLATVLRTGTVPKRGPGPHDDVRRPTH